MDGSSWGANPRTLAMVLPICPQQRGYMAAVMSTNEMPSAAPALPVDPKVKLSDASSADPAQDTADRHGGNSRGGLLRWDQREAARQRCVSRTAWRAVLVVRRKLGPQQPAEPVARPTRGAERGLYWLAWRCLPQRAVDICFETTTVTPENC
jgi:hypothetical protein